MLFILLSWIYILVTTVNLGIGLNRITRNSSNDDFVVTVFKGLFLATILASFWAIFGRINWEFHLFLLITNLLLYSKFKSDINTVYQSFASDFLKLSKSLQLYLAIVFFLIVAQCASIPFIIDNETYYIQTIKWLNEYGFVQGLANLHIFFGQTSGWHITQSVFNFSFIYTNFNDLSGFCLFLGNVFAIQKLNSYFSTTYKLHLIIGLLPIANVLLFQFISAPSPDIVVYVVSFIVLFYFIENYNTISIESFKTIVVLVLFLFYCKPTSFLMFLLPLILLIVNYKKIRPHVFSCFVLCLLILGLFITKNTILTGYPLFPTTSLAFNNYDFKVPKELADYHFNQQRLYRFFLTKEEFHSLSFYEKCLRWISMDKISGWFNVLSVIMVIVLPYFIKKGFNQRAYWIVYFLMVVQLVVLITTSPQFRFFIHFNLFFGFLIASLIVKKKRLIQFGLYLSLILVSIMLFFPIKYNYLTQNQLIMDNSKFSRRNTVFPHHNSKLKTTFHTVKNGNLTYFSPENYVFFWANGNGKLPCVNVRQIDYFGSRFHYVPQLRTSQLKDGFYSKKWLPND
ncbi:MAG: hypothetical protein J0L86_10345 [Flavobacteriales bacterium]|nr:hypothetical protein [Flavobacteriales bacterium]